MLKTCYKEQVEEAIVIMDDLNDITGGNRMSSSYEEGIVTLTAALITKAGLGNVVRAILSD
jgi:hypothetical protein